jgi:benzoylformate decarboxylase
VSPTAADWLLQALADNGVEVMFGNPGSTELPLVDAFPRQDRIRYVLGLHETTVMGMADGYAQQGNRLGVVNVHVQPGLANALSGILNAARARVPLLVTVGQQVTGLKDQAPFLGGELVALAKPIAKHAVEVESVDELLDAILVAIATARSGPTGPVVVSLPMDVLAAPAPDGSGRSTSVYLPPEGTGVGDAAVLLGSANAPAVLAGDGVAYDAVADAVIDLAERIGAPIYGEPFAARVPIATNHPLWRGALPGFASEIRDRLADHDVVIAVGMPVFRLFGDSPGDALPPGITLIHVDIDHDEIGRVHRPAVGISGPLTKTLERLLGALARPVSTSALGRRDNVARAIVEERAAMAARITASAAGDVISPAAFCLAIRDAVGPDDLIVDEALTSGRWLRTALIDRNRPDNWLAHRGSALGWGLPAAVGAKLADPTRRVMCIHGDGSFLFGVHALWTAARERLGLVVVVADNSGYEILRAGLEGLTGRPDDAWPGLALTDPPLDLVAISRGFGASAERIDHRGQLADALTDTWQRAESGPAVLVVPVTGRTPAVGYPIGG